MSVQNYFILTSAQRLTLLAIPVLENELVPRAVDNASPGTGINLNDNAADYEPGDPVTLTGTYVQAKRVVDDPDTSPDAKTFLLTLPWASLENETIFAPEEPG